MEKLEFELDISNEEIYQIQNDEIEVETFVKDAANFAIPDCESELDILASKVASLYEPDGGSPEVTDSELMDFKINETTYSGTFVYRFELYFDFGCDDISSYKDGYIRFAYELDEIKNIIRCYSTDPLYRSAYD